MRVPTIDLDGEVQLSPQEVDLVAQRLGVRLEAFDASTAEQVEERPLTWRAGPPGPTREIEDLAQTRDAAAAFVLLHLLSELLIACDPAVVRFSDELLELVDRQVWRGRGSCEAGS
jgi:hypothetical protein